MLPRRPIFLLYSLGFLCISALLVNACTTPLVVEYQSFHARTFSARKKPAKRHMGPTEDLLLSGYLLLGYIDVRQNIRKCWETNKCEDILEGGPSDEQLAGAAAARGGDAITWLEGETSLEPVSYSFCTNYTYTSVTINGKTSLIKVCNGYAQVNGFLEYRMDRALIWRLEPELATTEANQKAIEKAMLRLARDNSAEAPQTVPVDRKPDREAEPFSGPAAGVQAIDDGAGNPEAVRQMAMAIRDKDYATIRRLAEKPVVNAWSDAEGRSLLVLAVASGYHEAVNVMIENGFQWQTVDHDGCASIEYIAALGSLANLKTAVKYGGSMTFTSPKGRNLLFSAVYNKDPKVLSWLLGRRINPNVRDSNGVSALMVAARFGNVKTAGILIRHKAAVSNTDNMGRTALMTAAAAGNKGTIKLLLSKGAKISARDHQGNTALIYAAAQGKTATVDLLLRRGARLEDRNKQGATPFVAAWAMKKWDLVAHLLGRPAVIEAVRKSGLELLRAAVREGSEDVVQALLDILPPDVIRNNRNDLLVGAVKLGRKEVAAAFVDAGADINRRDAQGLTLLMQAVTAGKAQEAVLLVELGADTGTTDASGRTALMIATIKGQVDVVRRLRRLGVKK